MGDQTTHHIYSALAPTTVSPYTPTLTHTAYEDLSRSAICFSYSHTYDTCRAQYSDNGVEYICECLAHYAQVLYCAEELSLPRKERRTEPSIDAYTHKFHRKQIPCDETRPMLVRRRTLSTDGKDIHFPRGCKEIVFTTPKQPRIIHQTDKV